MEDKNSSPKELNVELVPQRTKKDCMACKLTGSVGLLIISAYLFSTARKQTNKSNRVVTNLLGSGRVLQNLN